MASPLATALALQQPMVSPTRPPVNPSNVLGAYQLSTDAANQQYLAKLQQQNALWGGLAGLGSAGILSLPRLLAMKGATGAAGNAASTAAGSLPADLSDAASYGPYASAVDAGLAPGVGTGGFNFLDAAAGPSVASGTGSEIAASAAPAIGAGDVAGQLAAEGGLADAATAAAPAAADAAGFSLADLLPFLFA